MCMLLDVQASAEEEANMLLVSRWDDSDANDGAVAAMVDALLATVAPAAADRRADLRPLVGEAGRALSTAGHGGKQCQGTGQETVPVHDAEEIAPADDDDDDVLMDGDEPDSGERLDGHDAGSPAADSAVDHVHITDGVEGCRLRGLDAEGLHSDRQQVASCMTAPHGIENGDLSHHRTELCTGASASKKARWSKAAERVRSRKKAKLTDAEQAVAVS